MKNKVFLIVILSMCCLMFSSCGKKVNIISEQNYYEYVDELYAYFSSDKNYVAIDLRPLRPDYATEHFKGFISYALDSESPDEPVKFVSWAKRMYGPKTAIFLIDGDGTLVKMAAAHLKGAGYKSIYLYDAGYASLRARTADELDTATGTDDCGC